MIDELKIFMRAVDLRSISAAARSLRLSPAAASHRILQLENRVGARLLNRTTRSLQPTEEGQIFYEHAVEVLTAVERAESRMASASGTPTGALRVTAPLGFGRRVLAPLVAEFNSRFPKVQVRLRLSDHLIDLLSEAVDVAIRMANPSDSSFVVRKLADCPRVLCASPDYLARQGRPEEPEDLLEHNCLLLRFPGSKQFRWQLTGRDEPITLPVSGNFDADDGDVLTEWALQGAGVVMKPYWEVADHLRSGALELVLQKYPPAPVNLVMLYPHRQLVSAKVKTFVDFMMQSRNLIEQPEPAARSVRVTAAAKAAMPMAAMT
ncbi:MAG: LysR family transcriptional regulator [Steroidobacteraceae bacterium]